MTIESDPNDPMIPYGCGGQHPKFPPSLNDFTLPANLFKILETTAVASPRESQHNDRESPQSPVPSELKPLMEISTVDLWETSLDVGTFYSEEPR